MSRSSRPPSPRPARTNSSTDASLEKASPESSSRLAVKTPAPAVVAATLADPGVTTAEKVYALTPEACRWCEGDPQRPDFFFCGAATEKGPYCARHRVAAYAAQQAAGGGPSRLLRRFVHRLPGSSYEGTQAAPAALSI